MIQGGIGRDTRPVREAPLGAQRPLTYWKKETYKRRDRIIEDADQESNVTKTFTIETRDTRKSNKSVRGMPWLSEAKKDVTSCEKPRGGANGRRSAGVRMGEPAARKARHHDVEPTRGTETSKYPEEEKTTVIS